ncbi:hypothetical protein [Mycolicibacterium pyrenivorans]|uniref:hypothetical protein n=1 Tax=Mycolicibacterium pyrenivorans TaxID=187102 RepID=UPI0021F34A2C|nr:hypothetical protein [Mycolicibacterium pyrenivorans]MCV7154351.1 hypothetical protein [Mycolicibacterium pyrenivorans]
MTLATGTANVSEGYDSSESVGSWNAYRRDWLRKRFGSTPPNLPDDTLPAGDDEPSQQGDRLTAQAQAFHDLNYKRADAVRAAFNRNEEQGDYLHAVPTVRVTGMEKWEGRVLEVDDEFFSAELVPLEGGPVVIADFGVDSLAEGDDVHPGDVVYVTVRTVRAAGGPSRTSAIRLRRLGKWTEEEVADQKRRAREQFAELANYIDD